MSTQSSASYVGYYLHHDVYEVKLTSFKTYTDGDVYRKDFIIIGY